MDYQKVLAELTGCDGVSGDEQAACRVAERLLKKSAREVFTDPFGNVSGTVGTHNPEKPTLLLDAHIDEIGLIVTYVTQDGFLKFSACGSVDARTLAAQAVRIYARGGEKILNGVITSTPPHLKVGKSEAPTLEDYCIDTGLSGTQAKKLIAPGDRVVMIAPLAKAGGMLTGKALDDRAGVAIVLGALEKLAGREAAYNIKVQFSAQEETGERGAAMGAFRCEPDFALAVDVSFALTAEDKPEKCGKLGGGAMIGVAPSLDRRLSKQLESIAQAHGIPHTLEIMGGLTGTNADAISTSRKGVRTGLVSVPLKYMHTPAEMICAADLEHCAALIAEFLCAEPV
ncbi:MAG: M20/M25/M40 family metallo-hydrolase [Oscillospiraceae bacterium]